ncbi:Hsp70 family protein [Thaumasiovibrio subtropicus]|uniref:Hsp70 family protein n=1 Tax=Thaumasiovibrio subtropicus TaxID=1891207 RepID=UPI000B359854|nr:Hsp70 family protein [Thaumasiovibrio subtropicus]
MDNQQTLIGIDLGTTNSAIAVWQDGEAILVPNALGDVLTPSVVSIDDENNVLVGDAAKSRMYTYPRQCAMAFKRFLGTEKRYKLGDKQFSPAELCAIVLQSLKSDAESYLDQKIKDVVISVPAYFNDFQRKEVRYAADLAGLNVVRLINEPTAACMAYSLYDNQARKFMVFDLGGGTFDVTIVEYQDSMIEVCASTGDNYLGGEDFTADLVDAVLERLGLERFDLSLADLSRIGAVCEQAKLARREGVTVQLNDPYNVELHFGPHDLEKIWQGTLQRLSKPIIQALEDSRLSTDALDSLIYVGGSTRLREVQQAATRLFGRFGENRLDPDHVVALGAATQAACRARESDVEELILTDVCPYSMGIATTSHGHQNGHYFSPIIERNTVIPTSRSSIYNTVSDNQRRICVEVFQGESPWVKDNLSISEFHVDVPPAPAGHERVEVRFSYDINGLLEVDATVLSTGKHYHRIIDQSPSGVSEQARAASLKRLALLKQHPRDSLPNIALLEKLNQLHAEKLEEEREWLNQVIRYFIEVLEGQNLKKIDQVREEITLRLAELGYR